MQRLQAFKYELMPNGEQARQMRRFAGSCRFVFNEALAWQKSRHDKGEKKLGWLRYRNSREALGELRNVTVLWRDSRRKPQDASAISLR